MSPPDGPSPACEVWRPLSAFAGLGKRPRCGRRATATGFRYLDSTGKPVREEVGEVMEEYREDQSEEARGED